MITFEVRFQEGLGAQNWQFKGPTGQWSGKLTEHQLARALAKAAERPYGEAPKAPQWSKPIDHAVRRRKAPVEDMTNRYEIKGGKVQRIAATAAERNAQQFEELAALLEGLEP